jgi:hypothetical protein
MWDKMPLDGAAEDEERLWTLEGAISDYRRERRGCRGAGFMVAGKDKDIGPIDSGVGMGLVSG